MSPPKVDELGKYWDARDQPRPFCSIGDPTKLRVLVPVPATDYDLLKGALRERPGALRATLVLPGLDETDWKGKLTVGELPESPIREAPVQLTRKGGGPLVVKSDSPPVVYAPDRLHYAVSVAIHNPGPCIHSGVLARVVIFLE